MRRATFAAVLLIGVSTATGAFGADIAPAEAGTGELCLGIAGIACEKGLFCETDAGTCKIADAAGEMREGPPSLHQ